MKLKFLFTLVVALAMWAFYPANPIEAKTETYTITPDSKTYKETFESNLIYNNYTKHYFLIRSYLEQLEQSNGGTLVLKKGTYTVSHALFVPSNVTIKLEDGVKIVKGHKTGIANLDADKSIFQLVRPSFGKEENLRRV